ncbi:hypothetical protein EMA8858_01790 [Emticicia aquatica]|uniref:DUF1795 domain-containing protein n=1 Tax=Emticicia aquatica TaxID=1681835 RepID=A0ABN8ERY7_9BACT|nr:hypothetical protein [Emticicia aquatica]CAH0995665.1 hypothetical protein EMA8858_01790 [Emticicia aquatica]
MKTLLLSFLIFIGFASNATFFADSIKVLDFKPYKINYPNSWKLKAGCAVNECSILAPTDTLTIPDSYLESINLTFNPLPSASYTVDKYAQFSIEYLPKVVKNFKVVEKKKLKPNVIRLTYTGEKDTFKQTWRQYYYVKSSKVYIVTFSGETSKYNYYQPFIESFLNSFSLK